MCPSCLATGPGTLLISAIPKRTGIRGNPILECKSCRKTFTYPRLVGGKPMKAVEQYLTDAEVQVVFDSLPSLGRTNARPYLLKFPDKPKCRKEIIGLISLSLAEYRELTEMVKSGATIAQVEAHFPQLNYDLSSILVRAELARRSAD